MRRAAIFTVFRREFKALFFSPIAYIVLFIYLLVSGWFFFSTFFVVERADMRNFFEMMPIILSFTIPALTMRLFTEEFKSGTFEVIATQPLTYSEILIGKYLSTLVFVELMIAPTLFYPLFIALLSGIEPGPVIGGYLGALFLSGSYIGLGVLASSLTRNQVIAFLVGATVCLFISLISFMLPIMPENVAGWLSPLSSTVHFDSISRGVIDSRDLLYFISISFLCLYSANLAIKEKI